jgi:hypothetical protein
MSCCAVTGFYHKTKALRIADPEQIVPGIYPAGIDHPEFDRRRGPRAFLIGTALKDFVPLVFEVAGGTGRLGKVKTDDVHKLNRGLREACYGWMLQHLARRAIQVSRRWAANFAAIESTHYAVRPTSRMLEF